MVKNFKRSRASSPSARFFGLVFGHEREFGYFLLSELEEVRGSMGLPIERDLYFKPVPIEKLAPEMFGEVEE